jgi:hypothetical protein
MVGYRIRQKAAGVGVNMIRELKSVAAREKPRWPLTTAR